MRTGKMPAGLARYWASHSRKKARANPRRKRRVKRNAWFEKRQMLTIRDYHRAPRHRVAAIKGRNRRSRRRLKSTLWGAYPAIKGASTMARRRRRHNPVASNYRRRHSAHRRRRRNPPVRLGGVGVASLGMKAAGVGIGILGPTMILKSPGIPAALMDSPLKRILLKIGVGYALSRVGRRVAGSDFGTMVLVGTAANILMADIFPRIMPQTGVGLAEGYQDLPMLSGGHGYDQSWLMNRGGMDEFPSEGMGEFPSEASNVNEFAEG